MEKLNAKQRKILVELERDVAKMGAENQEKIARFHELTGYRFA